MSRASWPPTQPIIGPPPPQILKQYGPYQIHRVVIYDSDGQAVEDKTFSPVILVSGDTFEFKWWAP